MKETGMAEDLIFTFPGVKIPYTRVCPPEFMNGSDNEDEAPLDEHFEDLEFETPPVSSASSSESPRWDLRSRQKLTHAQVGDRCSTGKSVSTTKQVKMSRKESSDTNSEDEGDEGDCKDDSSKNHSEKQPEPNTHAQVGNRCSSESKSNIALTTKQVKRARKESTDSNSEDEADEGYNKAGRSGKEQKKTPASQKKETLEIVNSATKQVKRLVEKSSNRNGSEDESEEGANKAERSGKGKEKKEKNPALVSFQKMSDDQENFIFGIWSKDKTQKNLSSGRMSHAQVWRDMARKLSHEFLDADADIGVLAQKIKDKFSNWKKKYTAITKAIEKTGMGDKEKDTLTSSWRMYSAYANVINGGLVVTPPLVIDTGSRQPTKITETKSKAYTIDKAVKELQNQNLAWTERIDKREEKQNTALAEDKRLKERLVDSVERLVRLAESQQRQPAPYQPYQPSRSEYQDMSDNMRYTFPQNFNMRFPQ